MKLSLLLFMAILILLNAPACSPLQGAGASSVLLEQATGAEAASDDSPEVRSLGPPDDIPAPAKSGAPEGMVAFEGDLFVATTLPLGELWQRAGWRIGDQPIDTNSQETPADCTLYPHAGVPDQWVGACRGYILIPEKGAQHIAVVITNPNGSTTLVQVAPLSAGN